MPRFSFNAVMISSLPGSNAKVLLQCCHDLVTAPKPARCCSTNLDVVFSNRVAHEHGVEGGYLVDTHAGHTNHLSHVMHSSNGQPSSVLPLCEVQQGDDGRPLVPVRVDRQDCLSASVVFRCELKCRLMVVLSCVPVYN